MVKRIHLEPRERAEMVEHLMVALRPQLEKYVKDSIKMFAITDEDIGIKVMELIVQQVDAKIIPIIERVKAYEKEAEEKYKQLEPVKKASWFSRKKDGRK